MKKLPRIPLISSFYASKYFIILVATLLSKVALADFLVSNDSYEVTFYSEKNNSYVSAKILPPEVFLPNTRAYAQYVMDSYQGWDLKADLSLRGFSFKYVDNSPCAGFVSYLDGSSCIFYRTCGLIEDKKLTELLTKGLKILKIDEILHKKSKANLY